MSGPAPTWTPKDAATLKALLDRYLDSRAGGLEVGERDPALARADLKGRHEVTTRPQWDLRFLRQLDRSFLIRLMPYDRKLSDKLDEVRRDVGQETRDLRLELFITKIRLHGTPSRIPRALATVKKQLSSMGRDG